LAQCGSSLGQMSLCCHVSAPKEQDITDANNAMGLNKKNGI